MERICRFRRASTRFRFHCLRQRGGRDLPAVAGSTDDGPLGIPDPAEATGVPAEVALAFKDAYRMLNQRVGIFTSLPLRSLDQLTLQTKLSEIGHIGKAVEA
jgi:hypothetical protein